MKVYIAYKLSKLSPEEKNQLRPKLEHISRILENFGNTTFIMGRDLQNWTKEQTSSLRTLKLIIKNLHNYDILVAFIDSNVNSLGLLFELIFAKLTSTPILFLIRQDISKNFYKLFSNDFLIFNDVNDLENLLIKKFNNNENN